MKVELLYVEGCPGHEALLPELRRLLDGEGIEVEIELREIEGAADAERERFLGSPTVRIDGEDVDRDAVGREDFGLKCRLYRDRGAVSNTPPAEWIRGALLRARRAPARRTGPAAGRPRRRSPPAGRRGR